MFQDADAAVGFMSGLLAQVAECEATTATNAFGQRIRIAAEAVSGPWATGYAFDVLAVSPPPQPSVGSQLAAVRVGSSVAVVRGSFGEDIRVDGAPPSVTPQMVTDLLRPPLDAIAPTMCRWTAAGC